MVFVWIGFICLILALVYFGSKWIREKKGGTVISKEGMSRLKMSIGERLERKEKMRRGYKK